MTLQASYHDNFLRKRQKLVSCHYPRMNHHKKDGPMQFHHLLLHLSQEQETERDEYRAQKSEEGAFRSFGVGKCSKKAWTRNDHPKGQESQWEIEEAMKRLSSSFLERVVVRNFGMREVRSWFVRKEGVNLLRRRQSPHYLRRSYEGQDAENSKMKLATSNEENWSLVTEERARSVRLGLNEGSLGVRLLRLLFLKTPSTYYDED